MIRCVARGVLFSGGGAAGARRALCLSDGTICSKQLEIRIFPHCKLSMTQCACDVPLRRQRGLLHAPQA